MAIAPTTPALMTIGDAGRVLALSRSSVQRLVRLGVLRTVRIGPGTRSRRIEAASVYDYLATLTD